MTVRPLGRLVEHDERSKNHPATTTPIKSVLHKRHAHIFNQGDLGSCTGNAAAGAMGTDPFWPAPHPVNEDLAKKFYELATTLDSIPGEYPPQDTGSSGLAVAKAMKELGWITSYQHAFGLTHALGALSLAPVIIGIDWFDSFDEPGPDGMLTIAHGATMRGGHEVELLGIDADARTVRGPNSWGTDWGDKGYFQMTWDTLNTLLASQGDVTAFTR